MSDLPPRSLSPSPDALESRVGDETVILHLGNDTYFGIDPLGTRIWQMLQERLPLPLIRDRLVEEYGIDAAQIEADLDRFIDDLLSHGLLVNG